VQIQIALDPVHDTGQISQGGARKGIKREYGAPVRVRICNAVAAPATVSGKRSNNIATGKNLGRRSKATTREPGNLPPVTVTRERVGRGVLA
jgi:hypothetical protein